MVDPTLTVSISRTVAAGGPTPLLFSARLDGTTLGIVEFAPPGRVRRHSYAGDSAYTHGAELVASALQQAVLGLSWMRVGATTEAQIQTSYDEVAAALDQQTYTVTVTVNGAAARVWSADPGSMELAANRLDRVSMQHLVPVYAVSIPVYPIPGA